LAEDEDDFKEFNPEIKNNQYPKEKFIDMSERKKTYSKKNTNEHISVISEESNKSSKVESNFM
jgi:hypothetical protein